MLQGFKFPLSSTSSCSPSRTGLTGSPLLLLLLLQVLRWHAVRWWAGVELEPARFQLWLVVAVVRSGDRPQGINLSWGLNTFLSSSAHLWRPSSPHQPTVLTRLLLLKLTRSQMLQ